MQTGAIRLRYFLRKLKVHIIKLKSYAIAVVINSETSAFCDLTVSCIATPSERASLALTNTSTPPLNTPERRRVWEFFPSGTLSDLSHGYKEIVI